jgi:hypothetical protein
MSGASAMAAARRRRAGTQEQTPNIQEINRKQQQENVIEENSNKQLSPLQILKLHDDKIKKIEELLNQKDDIMYSQNSKSEESMNIELMTKKMEELVTNKLNNINDIIKSMLLNIEKLSNSVNNNEKNQNKTEEFTNELNTLKMLVIKNQALSLETNNDIIKMKDELNDIKNLINDNNENDLIDSNSNDILKSMFNNLGHDENIFAKINIKEDDEEDITLKNIETLDITSIENLNEVRKDIVSELEKKVDKQNEKLDNEKEEDEISNI